MDNIHGSTGRGNSLPPGVVVEVLLDAGVALTEKSGKCTLSCPLTGHADSDPSAVCFVSQGRSVRSDVANLSGSPHGSVLAVDRGNLTTLHHREAVVCGGLPLLERPTDG